jgi:YihY family inner membrane protein
VNRVEQMVRAVDHWQQRRTVPAFVFAVMKKFGDDNAGSLSANLAFAAFGAIFPLLLLLVTLLGLVLAGDPSLRQHVLNSALSEFPIIGSRLGSNIHALKARSTPALTLAILGLVWSSMSLSQAGLFTMAQVWNLPGPQRPDYVHRLLRSFGFLAVMGAGLVVTTALASFGTLSSETGYVVGAEVLALLVNIGQYILAFRVLTPRVIMTRKLLPGAAVAGAAWTLLQALGGFLVAHELRGASEVYGTFAIVIGLMAWVFLGVRLSVYAAEINTVIDRHLWPRSIVQPPLTKADRTSLSLQAEQNQRRPEQQVSVSFVEGVDPPGEGSRLSNEAGDRGNDNARAARLIRETSRSG